MISGGILFCETTVRLYDGNELDVRTGKRTFEEPGDMSMDQSDDGQSQRRGGGYLSLCHRSEKSGCEDQDSEKFIHLSNGGCEM